MIKRAEAMLATRDIASARQIYKYLVQKGSGRAAYGLAQTYDPALLDDIGIAGMDAADLELAKKWYEQAALLGQQDAQERLKVIAAGTQ
jgi:TPR repeat protein